MRREIINSASVQLHIARGAVLRHFDLDLRKSVKRRASQMARVKSPRTQKVDHGVIMVSTCRGGGISIKKGDGGRGKPPPVPEKWWRLLVAGPCRAGRTWAAPWLSSGVEYAMWGEGRGSAVLAALEKGSRVVTRPAIISWAFDTFLALVLRPVSNE